MGFSEKILTKSLQQPKHDMIKCMILQTLSLKIIPPWGMLLYCTLSAWFDQSGNIYEVSSLLYFPSKSNILESLKLKYSLDGNLLDASTINICKMRLEWKSKFEFPKKKATTKIFWYFSSYKTRETWIQKWFWTIEQSLIINLGFP